MDYNVTNENSYNIHTVKTNKFKTVRMEIIFSSEVEKESMPTYAFLADLMSDTSKKYKTRKDVAIRLEDLYKATFYSTTSKVGNLLTITFVLEFINPSFIKEKNYLENVLKLPFEFINEPNIQNNEFDITNFNIVKKRMKEDILSINESSDRLAIINALTKMDSKSPSSFRVLGDINSLNKITPSSLYLAYQNLFKHFNCDIFLIGNIDMRESIKIIEKYCDNKYIKLTKPNLLVNNKLRKRPLRCSDKSNFVQSTLVMIYNISNLDKNTKDIDFHLFNYMLGLGGLKSKLYKNLRNDNSLCYGVRSLYLKYDELLIILVSLDKSNVKKAEKLITRSINEMIKGDFNDNDIMEAKKNLILSLRASLDNNVSILNNYVFNYFDLLPLIEDRIKLIEDVTKKRLVNCGKALSLNTVYTLDAGDNYERN